MPEDHQCKFDFKEEGRKKLEKDNPNIIGIKLNKI
jgi:hypothetical protein